MVEALLISIKAEFDVAPIGNALLDRLVLPNHWGIFAKELAIGDKMLTAKLFAGLAFILVLVVSAAKLAAIGHGGALPPIPVYLQLATAFACLVFAATYFNAARWLRAPLNQTLGLVQVGFIGISVGGFSFAVYLHPSPPGLADLSSYLITASALAFLVGCALFAANSVWAVIRFIRVQKKTIA